MAFSPDGRRLASGGADGAVRLWDVGAGSAATLHRHADEVWSIAFSPDGTSVGSTGVDKMVRIWDIAAGAFTGPEIEPDLRNLGARFSADWTVLAAADVSAMSRIDLADGSRVMEPGVHENSLRTVACSHDGSVLAGATWGGALRVWDGRPGSASRVLAAEGANAVGLSLSPDARRLATGGQDDVVKLWDVAEGRLVAALEGHTYWVQAVAFSPAGDLLASAGFEDAVFMWDVAGPALAVAEPPPHADFVTVVAAAPDGRHLASAGNDNTIVLWDPDGMPRATIHEQVGSIHALAFSPDGELLASTGVDGDVRLYDSATGAQRARLDAGGQFNTTIVFAPDGREVMTLGKAAALRLLDLSTGESRRPLSDSGLHLECDDAGFAADGSLVFCDLGGTIRLADPATGEILAGFRDGRTKVAHMAVSPDGRRVAGTGQAGELWVWDIDGDGRPACGQAAMAVFGLVFSPDGEMLVAIDDRGIVLIDADEPRVLSHLDPGAAPLSLAWSARGISASCHFGVLQLEVSRGTRTRGA